MDQETSRVTDELSEELILGLDSECATTPNLSRKLNNQNSVQQSNKQQSSEKLKRKPIHANIKNQPIIKNQTTIRTTSVNEKIKMTKILPKPSQLSQSRLFSDLATKKNQLQKHKSDIVTEQVKSTTPSKQVKKSRERTPTDVQKNQKKNRSLSNKSIQKSMQTEDVQLSCHDIETIVQNHPIVEFLDQQKQQLELLKDNYRVKENECEKLRDFIEKMQKKKAEICSKAVQTERQPQPMSPQFNPATSLTTDSLLKIKLQPDLDAQLVTSNLQVQQLQLENELLQQQLHSKEQQTQLQIAQVIARLAELEKVKGETDQKYEKHLNQVYSNHIQEVNRLKLQRLQAQNQIFQLQKQLMEAKDAYQQIISKKDDSGELQQSIIKMQGLEQQRVEWFTQERQYQIQIFEGAKEISELKNELVVMLQQHTNDIKDLLEQQIQQQKTDCSCQTEVILLHNNWCKTEFQMQQESLKTQFQTQSTLALQSTQTELHLQQKYSQTEQEFQSCSCQTEQQMEQKYSQTDNVIKQCNDVQTELQMQFATALTTAHYLEHSIQNEEHNFAGYNYSQDDTQFDYGDQYHLYDQKRQDFPQQKLSEQDQAASVIQTDRIQVIQTICEPNIQPAVVQAVANTTKIQSQFDKVATVKQQSPSNFDFPKKTAGNLNLDQLFEYMISNRGK